MLEFHEASLRADERGEPHTLLHDFSAQLPEGHLCGIIGPPGAGKTALLKAAAGLRSFSSGHMAWHDEPLRLRDVVLVATEEIAWKNLTVRENIETAFRLRAARNDPHHQREEVETLLAEAGLADVADQRVQTIDPAFRRRVALAEALAASPPIVLCDDFTNGLNPREEIALLKRLKQLAEKKHHLVIAATQSVRHLALYDSVVVLYEGMVAYHGPSPLLLHYFNLEHAEDLFPTLGSRPPGDWYRSWLKHREPYFERVAATNARSKSEQTRIAELFVDFRKPGSLAKDSTLLRDMPPKTPALAGFFVQASALLARRWRQFSRNGWEAGPMVGISLGAPLLLAWLFKNNESASPQWIAGLLLVLGVANGAREFAQRSSAFETETRAGVRPGAILSSTIAFLAPIIAAQAVWTAVILRHFGVIAGSGGLHVLWFATTIAAMSALALAISSLTRSADRAVLYATYFAVVEICVHLSGRQYPWILFTAIARGTTALSAAFNFQEIWVPLLVVKLHLGLGLLAAWIGLTPRRN